MAKIASSLSQTTPLHPHSNNCEEALARYKEKNSAYTELSTDLCHRVNNYLADLSMNTEMMLFLLEGNEVEKAQKYAGSLQTKIYKLATYIKGLSTIGMKLDSPIQIDVRCRTLIDQIVEFHGSKLKKYNISIQLDEINNDHHLFAHPGQVGHIFSTLILNAIDAYESDIDRPEEGWIKFKTIKAQNTISITVTNGGPRIDPLLADQIFEPFFTTREPEAHAGIGLTVSRMFAQNLGGTLSFDPLQEHTSFILVVPAKE
jgi:two-component system sensor histidine kinase TtrS